MVSNPCLYLVVTFLLVFGLQKEKKKDSYLEEMIKKLKKTNVRTKGVTEFTVAPSVEGIHGSHVGGPTTYGPLTTPTIQI